MNGLPEKDYRLTLRRFARKEILALPPKISDQVERTIDRLLSAYQEGERLQDTGR